ncbi:baeRF2 domain-containing protein [Herbiconiux solani]|uniref:baeRF2 domain-containing protein n=1 Tax=Herbiconiux solani TaxID=661329 RepID=UPI0008267022|nr:Vms1/Ankzf1 family peptidyl-tRNA hydrolase [Herbiconiux solani]
MSTASPLLRALADVYRQPGDYSTVYFDLSLDTGDPPQAAEERRRSIADMLGRAGAPQEDVDAVIDVLAGAEGMPSPVTAFALVRDGEVVVEDLITATPLDQESVTYGPLPDLVPLLKHAADSFHYLVVETARDGATITLRRVGRAEPDQKTRQQGRTDTLHASKSGGGWRQDYFQRHAEEIWRRTQSEVATTIDSLVQRYRPRLIVVTGDIRARQLLIDELSTEAQGVVRVQASDQEAEGADRSRLEAFIDEEIGAIIRADEEAVAELVREHEGRGDNRAELTVGGVVHALASAQVETLLIDESRLGDREVLALDGPPWVATAPEEALTAGILGSVPARLGLVRAALVTDARVFFARERGSDDEPVALPEGAAVAALLRWTTGPAVPGVDDL